MLEYDFNMFPPTKNTQLSRLLRKHTKNHIPILYNYSNFAHRL